MTHRAVQKWIERGYVPALPDGRIDFDVADAALAANGRRTAAGTRRAPTSLAEAQRLLVLEKIRLARLERKRRTGELVEAAAVSRAAFAEARRARDRLLAIPARVVPELVPSEDRARAFKLLEKEIQDALAELSCAGAHGGAKSNGEAR